MQKKYVITAQGHPILFDGTLIHKNVSIYYPVDSAGFFEITYDEDLKRIKVKCWGESNSLHIRSNPEADAMIIENLLNS